LTQVAPRADLVQATGRGIIRALPATALVLLSFYVYRVIIAVVPKQGILAHAHAATTIALEKKLGIFIEPRLRWWAFHHGGLPILGALDGPSVQAIVTQVYAVGQLPWLAAALFWLYLFRRNSFNRVAGLAIAGTLLGAVIAALYPVAPPRFTIFAGSPLTNVLCVGYSERIGTAHLNWNPYAAFPSLHVYWSLVTGYALALGSSKRMYRCLAAFLPLLMVCTVIVTANHYVIDCVGSLGLFLGVRASQVMLARVVLRLRPVGQAAPAWMKERAMSSVRDLDTPLVFAGTLGILQIVSPDHIQQAIGAAILLGSGISLVMARRCVARGFSLAQRAPLPEWWAGALFIVGTTMIGTTLGDNAAERREIASLLWLIAAYLPLLGRLNLSWFRMNRIIRGSPAQTGGYRARLPSQVAPV
jgi:hypothetical protein